MEVTFFGGAGGVTGSKHLVETEQAKVLLDCGIFQGQSDVHERNRSLPFAPESITHVVLSHAHLDHSGMLPILVKRGFQGPIISTPATKEVVRHMLLDAAHIEQQDAIFRAKHKIGAPDERVPLYDLNDVERACRSFVAVDYARSRRGWYELAPGVRLKFYDAGHVLGSAVTVLEIEEGGKLKRLGYSGDLGAWQMPLLRDPEVPEEELDAMLLESTYGGGTHERLDQSMERLSQAINDVAKRRGKMIVPAFSLGRTQTIIYVLHKLTDEGRIPRLPVYVDSPLASELMAAYNRYHEDYDAETARDFAGHSERPLNFRNLDFTASVEDSKRLNVLPGPFIIISASGMMTAGRVVHHLRHSIADERNAIFITGYQAEGTLGRRLLEGVRTVDLYGDRLPVRAEIKVFNEFSAHADGPQLVQYVSRFKQIGKIFLVHGEPKQAERLQTSLNEKNMAWEVSRAKEGQTVTI